MVSASLNPCQAANLRFRQPRIVERHKLAFMRGEKKKKKTQNWVGREVRVERVDMGGVRVNMMEIH